MYVDRDRERESGRRRERETDRQIDREQEWQVSENKARVHCTGNSKVLSARLLNFRKYSRASA